MTLLIGAAFLAFASQAWSGDTLQWIFVAGGALMIVVALADMVRDNVAQRSIDALVVLLGAWTVVEAFVFGGNNLQWWSFASAAALAGLATLGLIAHETSTERVVHELSVSHEPEHAPTRI
jgi:hypothetical protein